jgi:transposase, IS5 family
MERKGLFDEDFRLEMLSKQGDPLVKLNEVIEWESFRHTLNRIFSKEAKGPGGRPPYDYVMMFKILILQRLYNISDAQTQYQILDRLSFMRFLGLALHNNIPDEKTIWLFREKLTQSGKLATLFNKFRDFLMKEGLIAQNGNIVDASFVEVPRQRNNKEENEQIKSGHVPDDWKDEPHKLRQKDTDARWMTKAKQKHYGYKNHIKIDKKSKLINKYVTTNASVHDSQVLVDLIAKADSHHEMYGDSAYSGEPIARLLKKKNIRNRIHEKGYRDNPLTEKQKAANRKKSKVRARVEHVFGCIKNSMKGSFIRCIGIKRAEAVIGLINLCYNIVRYVQLQEV